MKQRRQFLAQAGLVAAAGLVPGLGMAQVSPVADTAGGKVRGVDDKGVKLFRGIPYGGDTGGKNRFKPPTRAAGWTGVRDCTDWGPIAPKKIATGPQSDYGKMVGWNNYRGGLSEDCLNLNVWTPATDHGRRAVMVAFHGGGYTSGSGNLVALEQTELARRGDVVAVTVNHRLGALGYTDLSGLGGAEFAPSGAVGMLDCVQALEWVRDNIAGFGGDPGNVTITGQSGGGGKCSTLMCMPSARGLFHKVAVQSGSTLKLMHHDVARRNADALMAKLGLGKGDLGKLRALPFDQIMAVQDRVEPVVDGLAIPRDPFDPDSPSVSAQVPMIIGTCLEDAALGMTDFNIDENGLKAWVETEMPGKSAVILGAYRKLYPDKRPFLIKAMIASDRGVRRNAVTQAERKMAGGAPAYLYRWDWPTPAFGGEFGAVHGTDLSMSFYNPDTDVGMGTSQARAMALRLGAAYVAFAKTGRPDNPNIPHWPAFNVTQRPVMVFDNHTRVENDPNGALRLMWDQFGV